MRLWFMIFVLAFAVVLGCKKKDEGSKNPIAPAAPTATFTPSGPTSTPTITSTPTNTLTPTITSTPTTTSTPTITSTPGPTRLVNYPILYTGGDFQNQGFVISSYPGTTLSKVVLWFASFDAGTNSVTLTAKSGACDGSVISTADSLVTMTGSVSSLSDYAPTTFTFAGNPTITKNSAVYFTMTKQTSDRVYYAVFGDYASATPIVDEMLGSAPPSCTVARNGIAILLDGNN